jgi:hypothetical protein
MLSLRVLSRSVLMLALVAACSSTGSATKAPPTHVAAGSTPGGADSTPAGPVATAPGNAGSVPTVPFVEGVDPWQRTATDFRSMNGTRYAYPCPPNGAEYTIWGTDTYTDDSSVCNAGVHAGIIARAVGGYVVIEIRPGQDTYAGTARNGVSSNDYATWGGSYVIIKL